jgi:hypothetical protein
VLILLSGCGRAQKLDTSYGKTYGTPGEASVNGTSVLMRMFKEAGFKTSTVQRFSPRLEKADVIVWAPDDFSPPDREHREYLENWLQAQSGRTVIYIGRDYDAAEAYWRQALPHAKPEQNAEYQRKLAEAISEWQSRRAAAPDKDQYARWFKTKVGQPRRQAATLEGPWAKGVNPAKCKIEITTRYTKPAESDRPAGDWQALPDQEVLLSSSGDQLVTRVTSNAWYQGQVIVVTNGSFLLNLPLVNKEHRKLAGKLIEESDRGGTNVVFVESTVGGPPIRKHEDAPKRTTGFDMLAVWPLNIILLHVIVWLLVTCVSLYPIFGRPRRLYEAAMGAAERAMFATMTVAMPFLAGIFAIKFGADDDDRPQSGGDFGRHLAALGEMLSLTGNQQFALDKIKYYQDHVKRDSGASHISAKPPKK